MVRSTRARCREASVDPIPEDTANHIRNYVADYGQQLIDLPDETWRTSTSMWMKRHWEVLVDLWTAGEGRSDMVLHARVRETPDGYRFHIDLVYVP